MNEKKNILIVDDRRSEVWFIDRILKKNGFLTDVAFSGVEGIRKAREGKPELIIQDMVLPDMDGSLVYQQLREDAVAAGIPVLFLASNRELYEKTVNKRGNAGSGKSADNRRDRRDGLTDFLGKPFGAEEILSSVDNLLKQQERATENSDITVPENVLVIDDNRSVVKIVETVLRKEGFGVTTAYTGLEALQKARDTEPALILLDIVLPELSGFEVLKMLRKHTAAPVIVLTSDNNLDSVRQCLALGANGYLVKPFEVRELVARVREKLTLSSSVL